MPGTRSKMPPKSYGQTWIRITIFTINWLRRIFSQPIDSKGARKRLRHVVARNSADRPRSSVNAGPSAERQQTGSLGPRYHTTVKKIVYLSLGSNLGDRQANLRNAIGRLLELGDVLEVSSLYETEPVEVTAQPWFLNCAVAVRTELIPREFLAGVLAIEKSMGRERSQPKGPRIIDIDILLFGAATINTQQLTVPHPAMSERKFVLEPLAEIAPEVKVPLHKMTVRELLDALPESGPKVKKIPRS